MKAPKHPNKLPRRCLYCGSTKKITHEHYWPQWLDSIMPARTQSDSNVQFRMRVLPIGKGAVATAHDFKSKQGHPRTKTVRFVCLECNTKWMNDLQQLAKPIVAPLITGENLFLTEERLYVVGKWATMTIMSFEFTDIETVSIPFESRNQFRETQQLLPDWYIWLARYRGERWNTRLLHDGLSLASDHVKAPHRFNAQATTFAVGELLIHAVSASEGTFFGGGTEQFLDFGRFYGLFPIWPFVVRDYGWHDLPILDDDGADKIANWVQHWAAQSVKG